MALGMLQRKEVEYRPRRERAVDHVERIRCLAAGGRTSLVRHRITGCALTVMIGTGTYRSRDEYKSKGAK